MRRVAGEVYDDAQRAAAPASDGDDCQLGVGRSLNAVSFAVVELPVSADRPVFHHYTAVVRQPGRGTAPEAHLAFFHTVEGMAE